MEVHPLAELIPAMTDDEYRELQEDIEANGLIEPITLYEGKILDGRHRAQACEELGIEPVTKVYSGDQPAAHVLSLNVKRRNLTTSQRAAIAVEFLPALEEEARERQKRLGRELGGRPSESPDTEGQSERTESRSYQQAGEAVGVGEATVGRAKRVANDDPEEFERLRQGETTVGAAHRRVTGESSGVASDRTASNGKRQPTAYFGKGDKWKESTEPLARYLTAWSKRNFEFSHVNPAEARKRLSRIDSLIEGLQAARADLEPRSQKAKLTL